MCFRRQARLGSLLLAFSAGWLTLGCQAAPPQAVQVRAAALQGPQQDIADLCGFACPEHGLQDGNAVISGVTAPDAFFAAVTGFAQDSDAVAASLEGELAAIAADFGISGDVGAGLGTLTDMMAAGPLRVHAGLPDCSVDASALLDAQAACDKDLARDQAVMRCAGSCELPPGETSCPSGADLRCTQPSSGRCDGLCSGTCTTAVSKAVCAGDCLGSCDGTCVELAADGSCQGPCDGTCSGQCALPEPDPAACDGSCEGSCAVDNPGGGCSDGLSVQCVVPATGEAVPCDGRCNGEPIPADGRAECMLAAKVGATLELACRPGTASIDVFPAPMPKDAMAQARYIVAVDNLALRLPRVLMLAERGERLFSVGDDLSKAKDDAMLAKSFDSLNQGAIDTRFAVGLQCAADQLPAVAQVVDMSSPRLQAALDAVDALRRALGIERP